MTSTKYAEGTSVTADRSLDEIRKNLARFGAKKFAFSEDHETDTTAIAFEVNAIRFVMRLTMPPRDTFAFHSTGRRLDHVVTDLWEKEKRRLWRTLALGIKAKLAMIDDGISTIEHEFLAYIQLPNGQTIGDTIVPDVANVAHTGNLPTMMFGGPAPIALGPGGGR